MAFSGTLDKCKACGKTVHVVDMLTLEGVPYHKYCFKCSHCKGTLVMNNYSSMDGVLYCKTHFEQLFKESGNFNKNFQTGKSEKPRELARTPSKLSALFSGTRDKCASCEKTVYPLEKVTLEGECYHKSCFRCVRGGCALTHSSYAALDGVLYCRHHFSQLFLEKGNYSHVLKSVVSHRRTASGSTLPTDPADNHDIKVAGHRRTASGSALPSEPVDASAETKPEENGVKKREETTTTTTQREAQDSSQKP